MNDFDQKLKAAQTKYRLMSAYVSVGIALVIAGVFGAIVFTNGTAVTVHPEEAASTAVVEVTEGFGFSINESVYAIADEPVIRVSAVGYMPEERKVSFSSKGGHIEITLRPLPGRLVATTRPPDQQTRWFIDERATAISEVLEKELEAGTYFIKADHPHFVPETRDVAIKRGEDTQLEIELTPVSGSLQINATPKDAVIRIDGSEIGPAPVDLAKHGGAYDVTVTHPDYITIEDTVQITNAELNPSRNYRLERKTARLQFETEPTGGHLLLDGAKVDLVNPAIITSKVDHQVTYLKQGYFAETHTINVGPDETKTVSFVLKREIGEVKIDATPKALVYVNGKQRGETPLNLKLTAVPQKISLRKAGYRSITKTVTPSSKTPVLISAKMQTELAARLAEAPREYRNNAGIALKLFQPGAFTMGAPRHEKGQRANEFIRSIKLEKPFYAGLYEVTKAQFTKFKGGKTGTGMGKVPVTSVAWEEAAAYCNWLSTKEGLKPFYNLSNGKLASVNPKSDGYRLLTEAEWEWLARRAGRKKQTTFPWGNKSVVPPKAGNIADESAREISDFFVPNYNDGYAEIAPVGSFPQEASGVFDMVGNVSEWAHDFYSLIPPEPNKTEIDPLGVAYGEAHVIKGSNWRSGTRTELRASYREGYLGPRDDLGFRVGRYLYGGD